MADWITKIKVGDTVIIDGKYGSMTIDTVARLTKTQIILRDDRSKFRRNDGFMVGGDIWAGTFLREGTALRLEQIRTARDKSELVRTIKSIALSDLSKQQLRDILHIAKGE